MRSRLTRIARIEVLEKKANEQQVRLAAGRPRDEHFEQAWQMMLAGMTEEHVAMVLEAWELSRTLSPIAYPRNPGSRLFRQCRDVVSRLIYAHWPYTEIPAEVVLAMPPEVAQVYLEHESAMPLHDCRECGYQVPHEFFKACPLCGGKIGWYAYWSCVTGQRV